MGDGRSDGGLEVEALQDRVRALEAQVEQLQASLAAQTESERRFRSLIDNAPVSVVVISKKGVIRYANLALKRQTGSSPQTSIVGRSMSDLIHPDSKQSIAERMKQAYKTGVAAEPVDQKFLAADGGVIEAIVVGVPCTFEGEPAIQAVFVDVTAQKRAERERLALESQIQQTQKLESIGVLAGGIAHDFNNLLVGVMGNADLALYQLAPEAPARGCVEDILVAGKRASDLIRQLLAYAGKGRFLVEPLALSAVVEEMAHLLQSSIDKKAALSLHFAPELPLIEADATQVRQIVMNLITNASDAMAGQDGVITVRTGAMSCDLDDLRETYLDDSLIEGEYVYLEVNDTGAGMDEETRKQLFDPFFTTKFAGRGLGLAAVLGIIRGHQGAIRVDSVPGEGSSFRVLFRATPLPPTTEPCAADPAAGTLGGRTILLADDDDVVLSVAGRMLRSLGCQVVTAHHGLEVLELFRREPDRFAAILLDLTMPQMDGETCFSELRRIRSEVRIILTSGYDEQEVATRFAGKGLAGFLQKPYRMAALSQKLRAALKG
jgi:PAS domain S-box-containing protein